MSDPNPVIQEIRGTSNNTAAAVLAGAAIERQSNKVEIVTIEGVPHLVVPSGLRVESKQDLLAKPKRLQQQVQLLNMQSFSAYVNTFASPETTIIFANKGNSTFVAALDYHKAADDPAHVMHRAFLTLQPTLAWREWFSKNNTMQDQASFAHFIEDHIPDIVSPDGASLVEMARNFEAQKDVRYQSYMRASDGSVRFTYNEEVTGASRANAVTVPAEFKLALQPYEGSKRYEVIARLRYKIDGGKLSLWYELVRIQDVLDAAFQEAYELIEAAVNTKIKVMVLGTI